MLVVLGGALTRAVAAQQPTTRIAVEALTVEAQARVVRADTLLRFRTRAVPGGRVDIDEGVLRAAYRLGQRVTPAASPEATARAYLTAEAARSSTESANRHVPGKARHRVRSACTPVSSPRSTRTDVTL